MIAPAHIVERRLQSGCQPIGPLEMFAGVAASPVRYGADDGYQLAFFRFVGDAGGAFTLLPGGCWLSSAALVGQESFGPLGQAIAKHRTFDALARFGSAAPYITAREPPGGQAGGSISYNTELPKIP